MSYITETGHFIFIVSLALSVLQIILWRQPAFDTKEAILSRISILIFFFTFSCFLILMGRFILSDFSVSLVANHSHVSKPLLYKVIALWGNHEGSMLLWVLILSIVSLIVACSNKYPRHFKNNLIGVQACLLTAFTSFSLLTSNPFARIFPPPFTGSDLNPLLQDPALGIHPPGLYLGYVGSSILFIFAVAGLLENKIDRKWASWLKPWARLTWLFLTIGIILGSRWAYYELGWGGWWFWDPVENASLMPWLIATALIHSLNVLEKRNAHPYWCAFLCLLTFSLSLIGTFLVRSGLITSVHSFASDPMRGMYILFLFFLFTTLSFSLFVYRAAHSTSKKSPLLSREGLILSGNIILVIASAIVFLGTTYPLILDAIQGRQISVGPPFYLKTMGWIGITLPLLMGFSSLTAWQKISFKKLRDACSGALLISIAIGIITTLLTKSFFVAIGFAMSVWLFTTTLQGAKKDLKSKKKTTLSMIAMWVAHTGIALFIIGAVGSSALKSEKYLSLSLNKPIIFNETTFTLTNVYKKKEANYITEKAVIHLSKKNVFLGEVVPEKRNYVYADTTTIEADFKSFLTKDIYITLGDQIDSHTWSVYIVIEPLILFLWLGAGFVILGGSISVISGFRKR